MPLFIWSIEPVTVSLDSMVLTPVGVVRSCFKQKFGIPRQSGLAPGTEAVLELFPPYGQPECLRGIEQYSHLWVTFYFHATAPQGWHSTVRPPRLGGDKRIGVFASRSNFRPNPIGLSAVRLKGIEFKKGYAYITVENHDLLDGSPILDVKPYLMFADSIPEAVSYEPPKKKLNMILSKTVSGRLKEYAAAENLIPVLRPLVESDPRPAYLFGRPDEDSYAIPLCGWEFRFRVEGELAVVYDFYPVS